MSDWKRAAEGWMAQTDREVAWRERLLAENARYREALEEIANDKYFMGEGQTPAGCMRRIADAALCVPESTV